MTELDSTIISRLNTGDESAFEQLFKAGYQPLYVYAHAILQDAALAEESVQQVFVKIWENRKNLQINSSIKAYLYRSVYHAALQQQMKIEKQSGYISHLAATTGPEQPMQLAEQKELEAMVRKTLNSLPEACRTIFQLSRFENMKYREIAEQLQLSVKTVEAQMSKALKAMRKGLSDYMPLVMVFVMGLTIFFSCVTR